MYKEKNYLNDTYDILKVDSIIFDYRSAMRSYKILKKIVKKQRLKQAINGENNEILGQIS